MGLFNFINSFSILLIPICFNVELTLQEDHFGVCGVPDCSAPVSLAKAHTLYIAQNLQGLTVRPGDLLTVYVKDIGEKKILLGVETKDGRRGYVPKNIVQETKAFSKERYPALKPFLDISKDDSPKEMSENADSQITPSASQITPSASNANTASSQKVSVDTQPSISSSFYPADQQAFAASDVRSSPVIEQPTTRSDPHYSSSTMNVGLQHSHSPSNKVIEEDSTQSTEDLPSSLAIMSMIQQTNLNRQIQKTLNAIAEHQETQDAVLASNVARTESPMLSETGLGLDANEIKTMKMLHDRCLETQGNNCDDYLIQTASLPGTESFADAAPYSSMSAPPSSDARSDENDQSTPSATSTSVITEQSHTDSALDDSMKIDHQSDSLKKTSDDVDEDYEENESDDDDDEEEDGEESSDKSGATDPHARGEEEEEDARSGDVFSSESKEDLLSDPLLKTVMASLQSFQENKNKSKDEAMPSLNLKPSHVGMSTTEHFSASDKSIVPNANKKISNAAGYDGAGTPRASSYTSSDSPHKSQITNQITEENPTATKSFSTEPSDHITDSTTVSDSPSDVDALPSSQLVGPHASSESSGNGENQIPLPDTRELSPSSPSPDSSTTSTVPDDENEIDNGLYESTDPPAPGIQHRSILEDNSGDDENESLLEKQDHIESVTSGFPNKEEVETSNISGDSTGWIVASFSDLFVNFVEGLRQFLELVISLIPEPLYSWLMSMNSCGVSSRAVVFAVLSIFPGSFLIVTVTYIQRNSKENSITAELCSTEQKLFHHRAERVALIEENCKLRDKIDGIEKNLAEDHTLTGQMQEDVRNLESKYQQARVDIKSHEATILVLSEENEDLRNKLADANTKYEHLSERLRREEGDVLTLSDANEKMQDELDQLSTEKQQYMSAQEMYKEKISNLEQSCKQLLQEAEIWNVRVTELSDQVFNESAAKKEAEELIESKDAEIEALKSIISNVEVLKNAKDSGEVDKKVLDESMQALMDAGKVQVQLKKTEELSETLSEKLKQERNKILAMEVELLESKSEVEKVKAHYKQALQDRTEAQTKLDVLTKYFKDKELQLQKELGVHEAVRQRKEEDATHAERQIHLIDEENASYKFQVVSLKQEIEETERNLKNQIATQEKKAHENWLAARAAERKMEEMKQENTQFRKRLTLLEREQEKWSSSAQNDLVRAGPPQRSLEQGHDELNANEGGGIPMEFLPRHIPPPLRHPDDILSHLPGHPHLPGPPHLSPHGRPLLPPPPSHSPRPLHPPMMPPFLPPPHFDPVLSGMLPHRPVPWGAMSEKRFDPERRKVPSDYDSPSSRRNQTPPRSDSSRRSVSPTELNSRSRSSSPTVPLPDFHNTPPRLGRPDFPPPPPGTHMRFMGGPPSLPPHMMMPRRDLNVGASPYRDGHRPERFTDDASISSGSGGGRRNPTRRASEEEV